MQQMATIRYEEEGNIARVWLDRERINVEMVNELTAVCDQLEDTGTTKVVVFRGTGGQFCRGIDFQDFRPDEPVDIHGFNKWEKLCVRIERLPKATVAALEGEVLGGGVQLALVCDARIAAPGTTLQFDEVQKGFLPGMATFRLAKYIGLGRAKRLILQGAAVDEHEAVATGMVDSINDDLEQGIKDTIAAFGPIWPVSVQLARRLLNESYSTPFEDAIGNFLAAQHRAISQNEFMETLKNVSKKQPTKATRK